jgi:hypothetical protein
MSRHEPLTSLPARSEDCFAQFDAVFNALATELAWSDHSEPSIVPPARMPAAPIISLSLVGRAAETGTVVEPPAADDAPQDGLEPFDSAFDRLDTQLANVDQPRPAATVAAGGPADATVPPVYEVDSSWFGEGVDRIGGVAPPPVQQVRLAPSPNQLQLAHPPSTIGLHGRRCRAVEARSNTCSAFSTGSR